jgi:tetratricopeptide (TPR) repeat protein
MLDHPEFYALWNHAHDLPNSVEIAGVNPRLHLLLHQVAETQLIQETPPETAQAVAHLISLGVSRHRALHLVLEGITTEIWTAMKEKKPADNERYGRHLQSLIRARSNNGVIPFGRRPGRNDSCPCGSGKKYKKCCMEQETSTSIDLPRGRMLLPSPFVGPHKDLNTLPDNDPLIWLGNLSAVAAYLEHMRLDEATAAAYRQLVMATETLAPHYLENALQDFQLFTLNHSAYADEGIAITKRLVKQTKFPDMVATYRLDLADLHDLKAEPEEAERIFREVIAQDPPNPYVHLRWARHLEEKGNTSEAETAYQRVIGRAGMGDPGALAAARHELADLLEEQGRKEEAISLRGRGSRNQP